MARRYRYNACADEKSVLPTSVPIDQNFRSLRKIFHVAAWHVTQASCLSRRTGILPGRGRAGWEARTTSQAGSLSYFGCGASDGGDGFD